MSADTSQDKWTIGGVSPGLRKVARDAARRENMKLGDWLEHAIQQTAREDAGKSHQHPDTWNPRPNRRYF
jgi:hypothetical protein